MNKEIRSYPTNVEIRELDDGKKVITGYAIVFNSESRDLGGFKETIKPEAMNEANISDVVALFNHDPNIILGRTDKTLKLEVDEKGVRYTISPPNGAGNIVESIERGDVRGSSFGFTIAEDGEEWERPVEKNGSWSRTITKFDRIFDVSPVVFPAYEASDTSVAKRSLGMRKDEIERKENEEIEREKIKKEAEVDNHLKKLRLELLKYND